MAKVQLTVEELLQLARGEMPVEEIKQQLAKGMLEVWNSPDTQTLIQAEAERLAQIKVERIIRDSLRIEKGNYRNNYQDILEGWAVPVVRQALMQYFSIPTVLEAIKPEIDQLVQESMGRAMATFFSKGGGQ